MCFGKKWNVWRQLVVFWAMFFFLDKTVQANFLCLQFQASVVLIFFLSSNPFPSKPLFLCVCSTSLLKKHWEKEKFLVTSNFSFFHSVFYPFGKLSAICIVFRIVVCKFLWFGMVSICCLGKGYDNSLTKSHDFWSLLKTLQSHQLIVVSRLSIGLLKTLEKEKMVVTSIFSFFQNAFCPGLDKFY